MRAEYINPFLESLTATFEKMLKCKVRRGRLELKAGFHPEHAISGIIGLSGKIAGSMVLSLSASVAIRATSVMLMCEIKELNDEVEDTVGELANIVAGSGKQHLSELNLSIGLPNVVRGNDFRIGFPSKVVPITVPCETDWGPLALEIGLEDLAEPVA